MAGERPMALDAIEGQPRVVELLRRTLAGDRVAHTYAFVGPPGSGRMAAALAFAQALLCADHGATAGLEQATHGASRAGGPRANNCQACGLVVARRHPDLHVVTPTPPETNPRGARAIRISAIRELERRASLRPALAARKVFIVEDADRMTEDAPQAFLKTLEEPPDRTVIILLLPRPRALPATILSRCQLVRFQPRAESGQTERTEALEILREVRARGAEALFRHAQGFERDRERAERVVDAYWLVWRDLVLAKCGAPAHLLGDPGAAEHLSHEAGRWSLEDLAQDLESCREAREALAVNVTPRLTMEVLLSRLARGVA